MKKEGSLGFGVAAFILSVVFLILKLCGVISWGWVWIFLPLIIYAGFWLLFILFLIIIFIVCAVVR